MADNPLSCSAYSPTMCCRLALTILIKGQAENSFPYKAALANLCGGKDITPRVDTETGHLLPQTWPAHRRARLTVRVCVCVGVVAFPQLKPDMNLNFPLKRRQTKVQSYNRPSAAAADCATCAARHVQRAATMTNIGGYKRNGLQTLIEFAVNVILWFKPRPDKRPPRHFLCNWLRILCAIVQELLPCTAVPHMMVPQHS